MATIGAIHFIEAEGTGLMKIGFSVNPRHRLHSMQSGIPNRLVLHGTVNATAEAERALHEVHKPNRTRGEWYPLEYAMSIYDDLGEECEDTNPVDMGAVVVTAAIIRNLATTPQA